ncbi:MAG: hypothetical protein J3Q66DRAFT_421128 [Benniella sp.]|nr:MAG: hypothetical protein J3Q66DRAFT_421128 [Benniella sp.]
MMADSAKKIALTNADSWLGCSTACYLAEQLEEKCEGVELVCLARKPERLDKLKRYKNVRIEKVDYNDEKTLEKALSGVTCTTLIPENDEHRVESAKNTITAMKNAEVKSCMMISVEGADGESSHLKELQSYHEIEEQVEQCESYLILRKSILHQCFLLWSHVVRERSEFPISTSKQSEMAPLDMYDLVCAVSTIVIEHCHHEDSFENPPASQPYQLDQECDQQIRSWNFGGLGDHKNKTYTLTGPQKVTPECIAKDLTEIIGKQIKVKEVERSELKKYFESLGELQKPLSQTLNRDRMVGDGDHDHIPISEIPIELFLDELELINKGDAGSVSGDLEKIVGHPGNPVKNFLCKERDVFKPHRD